MAKAKLNGKEGAARAPRTGIIRARVDPSLKAEVNAMTQEALRDADNGKDLHRYGNVDEMFKALGF